MRSDLHLGSVDIRTAGHSKAQPSLNHVGPVGRRAAAAQSHGERGRLNRRKPFSLPQRPGFFKVPGLFYSDLISLWSDPYTA